MSETENPLRAARRMLGGLSNAVLRLGVQLDINGVEDRRWAELVRKFYLVSVLTTDRYVAVAGEQGAGKTTVVGNLYPSARPWLRGNNGRGEKNPVTVIEEVDLAEAYGVVVRRAAESNGLEGLLERKSHTLATLDVWLAATRGEDPAVLMTELHVPAELFQVSGAGLVLLPGWERTRETGGNPAWQELMRMALGISPAALVVVDETRLANATQVDLRERLGAEPGVSLAVAVSRCEGKDKRARAELVARAAEVYRVDPEVVVPVGGERDAPGRWPDRLFDVLDRIRPNASDSNALAVAALRDLVRADLATLLDSVKVAVERRTIDTTWQDLLDEFLDTFDNESASLRHTLDGRIAHHFDRAHLPEAQERLQADLDANGGWREVGQRIGDFARRRGGLHAARLRDAVTEAWQGGDALHEAYRRTIDDVVAQHWHQVRPWVNGGTSFTQLVAPRPLDAAAPDDGVRPIDNRRFTEFVRALPAMALYTRTVAIKTVKPDGTIGATDGTRLSDTLSGLLGEQTKVLAEFARFLNGSRPGSTVTTGVDRSDAKALFTAGGERGLVSAATALVSAVSPGIAALAVLLKVANDSVRERDNEAFSMLGSCLETTKRDLISDVDDVLRQTKDRLRTELAVLFNLDDQLDRKLRLAAAAEEVREYRSRVLEALSDADPT